MHVRVILLSVHACTCDPPSVRACKFNILSVHACTWDLVSAAFVCVSLGVRARMRACVLTYGLEDCVYTMD